MKNVTLVLIDNNMDIRNFILHQKFENIDKEIERIERERQNNGFNLFTISSYNSYLENFHSDVIALLLSPKERHLQKEKFFKLFLSFFARYILTVQKVI